jgi:hypothetical protein
MLEDAVSENYVHNTSYISDSSPTKTMEAEDTMENASDDTEDSADLSTSQFVPLISYLSPTLGRLVSPYQHLTRQEVPGIGMSPRYSRDTNIWL